MKNLYVVENDKDQKVTFSVVKVYEETETEYIINTDLGYLIKNVGFRFPKELLNKPLARGFVTENINSKKIEEQLERIYKIIDETHEEFIKAHTMYREINKGWYNSSLQKIEEIRNKRKE